MVEKIDELKEIERCIKNRNNFLLSGGAGSGKTYSLVKTINLIKEKYKNKTIACITYTNVAVNEIKEKVIDSNFCYVSTIHDFLWENIKRYQSEIKDCIVQLINDERIEFKEKEIRKDYFEEVNIQYKEYLDIKNGIISHNEILLVANKMFNNYKILCDILKDKYDFILVDEYQDTNRLVIEILLEDLKKSKKNNIIGFFGDSMQSIYSDGIGDLNTYIENGEIIEIQKKQNRRNPQKIIKLANLIRTDGLIQTSSEDINAPNMKNGHIKEGEIKFIYSDKPITNQKLRADALFQNWNFKDTKNTKELNLTHNLIAQKAGFSNLMNIYTKDPIEHLKKDLLTNIGNDIINEKDTFENVLNQYPRLYNKLMQIEKNNEELYKMVKDKPFSEIKKINICKDSLFDDKKLSSKEEEKGRKRDDLINQLFEIQKLMILYKTKRYNEFIRKIDYPINTTRDKKIINEKMEILIEARNNTIEDVINLADKIGICRKDDRFNMFINKNWYLYERVKKQSYCEFENLFNYIEGFTPFSTQHKVKGTEFNNVLLILDNGNWNQYNFEYLFTGAGNEEVLKRTQKIFYVCCTRAKEKLYVYYSQPTVTVIKKAQEWFGKENVIKIK